MLSCLINACSIANCVYNLAVHPLLVLIMRGDNKP